MLRHKPLVAPISWAQLCLFRGRPQLCSVMLGKDTLLDASCGSGLFSRRFVNSKNYSTVRVAWNQPTVYTCTLRAPGSTPIWPPWVEA